MKLPNQTISHFSKTPQRDDFKYTDSFRLGLKPKFLISLCWNKKGGVRVSLPEQGDTKGGVYHKPPSEVNMTFGGNFVHGMYLLFYNKKQREKKKTSLFSGAISKMNEMFSHPMCNTAV